MSLENLTMILDLRFQVLLSRVFYGTTLTFGDSIVSWSVGTGAVLINYSSAGARWEDCFDLSVNSLSDYLIKIFRFEILVL